MQYTFNKVGDYFSSIFNPPHDVLVRLTAHNWTSQQVEKDILGTQKVISGQLSEYIWGSEAVYLVARSNGTTVYDSFDNDETPLFTITNEDALKFLEDFKSFLKAEGV